MKTIKKYKAYSLVEVIVTLGIIGILIVMLFNVILLALRSNTIIAGRSYVREQTSSVLSQISREIRNADEVKNCAAGSCEFRLNGKDIKWESCGLSICRYENTQLSLQTSDTINMNSLVFDVYPGVNDNSVVLVTITAGHSNPALNITSVINQISTTTRNYE